MCVDGALGVQGLEVEAASVEQADLFFFPCMAQNNNVF